MHKKLSNEDIKLLESLIEKYGTEFVINELRISKKFFPAIVTAGLSLGGGAINTFCSKPEQKTNQDTTSQEEYSKRNPYNMSDEDYKLFLEKVDAVGKEIDRVLSYKGQSKNDIDFNIENLVYQCYKYNFDLPLALAQAHIESHYGTTARSKRTHNMFSIGLYDNGRDAVKYNKLDDCIEPYIKIMSRDFMQNGARTVDDILKHGQLYRWIGKQKARYASNPQYEKKLRQQRNTLLKTHPILAQKYSSYNI